jgi:murein DD-endopeptidase MepM/ murein hydrolase activator NlpD
MNLLEQLIAFILSLFNRTPTIVSGRGSSGGGQSTEPVRSGNRHLVTIPENPTAHFHDTGSSAWVNQWKGTPMQGQHGGTDFAAPSGTPVYAPYAMKIIAIGYYPDEGRRGYYVIGTLGDGVEYYSGHLNNVLVKRGELIESGTQIGQTWAWWADAGRPHTHIQMKRSGGIIDPEAYFAAH